MDRITKIGAVGVRSGDTDFLFTPADQLRETVSLKRRTADLLNDLPRSSGSLDTEGTSMGNGKKKSTPLKYIDGIRPLYSNFDWNDERPPDVSSASLANSIQLPGKINSVPRISATSAMVETRQSLLHLSICQFLGQMFKSGENWGTNEFLFVK